MSNFSLYSEVSGSGEPIVFLPGMLATTNFWKNITIPLSKNYKTVSLDLLGFGKSPAPKTDYSLNDHLNSIQNTLEHLKINTPFTLVGHSMGGLLALEFAKKYSQKVKKLILISTPIFLSKKEAEQNIRKNSSLHQFFLYGLSAKISCYIFCKYLRPFTALGVLYFLRHLPKDVAKDTLLHSWQSYQGSRKNIVENQNPIEAVKNINCPIIMIYGEKDKRIKEENLKKLLDYNQNIILKKVGGVGHQLPLFKPEVPTSYISL